MKEIKLTRGYVALVDDSDYEYLNQFKWYPAISRRRKPLHGILTVYAIRSNSMKMHRMILKLKDSKILTDHKDHNGLNNQRSNLRSCSPSQNNNNMSSNGKSKYLGVNNRIYKKYKSVKGKKRTYKFSQIRSTIVINGKQKHLGCFKTELEAAIIYNIACRKYHGEFANPNIF